MKIKDIALSAAAIGERVVKAIAIGAVEVWSAIKYIVFKDKVVEQICANNWGDGKGITEEQAAAVTDLGTVFTGNTDITSFEELKNFTSLKMIGKWNADGYRTFGNCTNLKKVVIPETVTDIGYYAFGGCTSLIITIPPHIQRLERGAFYNVPISGDIRLPNLTEIGGDAINSKSITSVSDLGSAWSIPTNFMRENTSLTYCKIPSSCTTIYNGALLSCTNLEDIGSDLSHITHVRHQALYGTSKLKKAINFENLISMESDAHFRGSGIVSIRFGKLAEVAPSVCYDCKNLEMVELSSNTTSIGASAFRYCTALAKVIVNAVEPPTLGANSFANGSADMIFYVPDQSVTAYREASGWSAYADRILPMEAYLYGYIKFADSAVEAICLANWDTNGSGYLNKEEAKAVTDIGTVFKGNTEIVSFDELEEFTGVTKLNSNDKEADAPFMGCTSLTSIKTPQSVTEIGERSFSGCTALTEVGSLENVEGLGRWAFADTQISGELSLPNLKSVKYGAFSNTLITKASNLGIISSTGAMFEGCKKLVEVILPDTCTSISGPTFKGCSDLQKVIFPSSVNSIGEEAFYECKKLDITFNAPNLETLGAKVFMLSGIVAVNNLGRIKVLKLRTFQQCESLETVFLPSTLEKIEGYAVFYGCPSLKSVVIYATTPPQLEYSNSFSDGGISKGTGYIYVPDESVEAYKTATNWSDYASQIKPLSQYVEPTNE